MASLRKATMEFRPTSSEHIQRNDTIPLHDSAILTIEVGEPQANHNNVNISSHNVNLVKQEDLEKLLQEYAIEVDKHNKHFSEDPLGSGQTPTFSMEEAENEKQKLIIRLNDSFQLFLDNVKDQAKNYAKFLFKTENVQEKIDTQKNLLDVLQSHDVPIDHWRRKLNEIQSHIKLTEVKENDMKNKVIQDVSLQQDSTVGSHVATALNHDLDKRKDNYLQDIKLMNQVQDYQSNLLRKMSSSYITFYSWILEQWNRNMIDINKTYIKVNQKVHSLFKNDPTYQDIDQLLQRYEKFLQAHENHLPLEFNLTNDPRRDWKVYMSKQQPEECIRLMKTELKSLELIPALQNDIMRWKREVDRYDCQKLHKMNENRKKIQKRIEDAIEVETKQTCQKKWKELNERIYGLGTGLQKEAYNKFGHYNNQYKQQQSLILSQNEKLHREIMSYESRLSLIDKPWADWLEKRKMLQKEWATANYWALSIHNLIQVYEVIHEFRKYVAQQVPQSVENSK